MRVGIVGSEEAKFTESGKAEALQIISQLLTAPDSVLVSGHCHLGGIDIWAEEEATRLGRQTMIFPPAKQNWHEGYKPRNLEIARVSHIVHCITVKRLPDNYKGMTFAYCYHCGTDDHIKSGGCWTMHRALKKQLHIVENKE